MSMGTVCVKMLVDVNYGAHSVEFSNVSALF